jgi:hypothetical protein
MINKREQNISSAFAASLSFGFNEKEADYSLDKEDLVISKYAGMDIYQPTIDNVELFIRKYILNELTFFPRILDVGINLIPSSFDSVKKDHVKDATGLIGIKLHGKNLEIPFMIRDAELLPFDVIQMDGQRVPYSRENLKKVIFGLDKAATQKQQTGPNSPYEGLDKVVNPTTSPGFLGDVLQIQDQHIRRKGNDMYVTASQKIDEALEKVASITPLTWSSVKSLQIEFKKKAKTELTAEYEKLAAENEKGEPTEKQLNLFQRQRDAQFVDANTLPNGTVISFPEKDGKDLVMTKGIIISDYMGFAGDTFKSIKVVIAQDGRMRILSSAEKFLCFKATDQLFSIPKKDVAALNQGDIIIAFDGNKALYPSTVKYIKERFWDRTGSDTMYDGDAKNALKVYDLEPIANSDRLSALFTDSGNKDILETKKEIRVKLSTLNGTKFNEMPYDQFIAKKSEETGIDEMTLSSMLNRYDICIEKWSRSNNPFQGSSSSEKRSSLVFVTSPETKVIPITGVIRNFLRDKNEFEQMETTASFDLTHEEGFEKFASANENIRVECVDRRLRIYNVTVRYSDKSKKMFKQMEKKYNRISQDDLFAIMKMLNFSIPQIQDIIMKAKNEPYATTPLPMNADGTKLNGGAITNMSVQNVKNTVGRFLDPQTLTNAIVANMVGNMVVSGIKAGGPKAMGVAEQLKKFAKESKALSSEFEKIAIAKESKDALAVSKLMALNVMFSEKVAATASGEAVYPRIYDVAATIKEAKPFIEKVATDLITLKAEQAINRVELINPNYIQAAVNEIDNLYKLANAVDEANPINKKAESVAEELGIVKDKKKTDYTEKLKKLKERRDPENKEE